MFFFNHFLRGDYGWDLDENSPAASYQANSVVLSQKRIFWQLHYLRVLGIPMQRWWNGKQHISKRFFTEETVVFDLDGNNQTGSCGKSWLKKLTQKKLCYLRSMKFLCNDHVLRFLLFKVFQQVAICQLSSWTNNQTKNFVERKFWKSVTIKAIGAFYLV